MNYCFKKPGWTSDNPAFIKTLAVRVKKIDIPITVFHPDNVIGIKVLPDWFITKYLSGNLISDKNHDKTLYQPEYLIFMGDNGVLLTTDYKKMTENYKS